MSFKSNLLSFVQRVLGRSRYLSALMVVTILPVTHAATPPNQERAAQEIATLFRAARKVISDNQDLINDPEKGDKGLSAAAVITKAKANYYMATNKTVDESDPAMQALLDSIAEVMTSAQPRINETGRGFKGFLPAIFARELAEKASTKLAGRVFIKLTAPKNYLRNPANSPDDWEDNIIENKFRLGGWIKGKEFAEHREHNGKKGYRLALPEYYTQSCLSCHGEVKGERDITGGLKEGAKLGELGGAISVVIYEN